MILILILLMSTSARGLSLDSLLDEVACGIGVFKPNVSCHYAEPVDDIHSIHERAEGFPDTAIFFIEASCGGGLNFRQACAVEAAAKVHPTREINVLFAGPIPGRCLFKSPLSDIFKYKNVNIYRVYVKKLLKNTPVSHLWASSIWNISYYPVHHTADLIKFAILSKYGGTYLDLDSIVVKSLDKLPQKMDWVGKEDDKNIGVGLLSASKNGIGTRIAYESLKLIKDNYRPQAWSYHSVTVFTEVLKKMCNTTEVSLMSADTCQGFELYDNRYFYRVPFQVWKKYFQETDIEFKEDEMTYAYHIWNNLSKDEIIYHDSVYAQIMRRHCPKIFNLMSARK